MLVNSLCITDVRATCDRRGCCTSCSFATEMQIGNTTWYVITKCFKFNTRSFLIYIHNFISTIHIYLPTYLHPSVRSNYIITRRNHHPCFPVALEFDGPTFAEFVLFVAEHVCFRLCMSSAFSFVDIWCLKCLFLLSRSAYGVPGLNKQSVVKWWECNTT